MSILYPRLLEHAARDLHQASLTASIEELTRRAGTRHPRAVFTATGGRRVTDAELEALRAEVVGEAERSGFPGEGRRTDRTEFDLRVARLLHERCGLVAAEAATRSVWSFLALVLLPDVAYWRFPRPPADRVLGTDITRHVLGRLWWRAHLTAGSSEIDRYELLDALGEAAFDQVFARRRSIGGSRTLVRALARAWPPPNLRGVGEREVLRDVLKRLLRVTGAVDLESLPEAELVDQVRAEARLSVELLEGSDNSRGSRHAL